MFRGLYTAVSSMQTNQKMLDVASNNMANVNTTGFKKDVVTSESFKETLIKKIGGGSKPKEIGSIKGENRLEKTYVNFIQGTLEETGNDLNFAIKGTGFFKVETPSGQMYTRNGSFTLSQNGEIVTSEGYPLLGMNGPINLSGKSFQLSTSGQIIVDNQLIDQINITDISNINDLNKYGQSHYIPREDAEIEEIPFKGEILQGFLEGSNINPINEMVNMIRIMRSYESSSKVVKAYDDMLQRAANDIGKL